MRPCPFVFLGVSAYCWITSYYVWPIIRKGNAARWGEIAGKLEKRRFRMYSGSWSLRFPKQASEALRKLIHCTPTRSRDHAHCEAYFKSLDLSVTEAESSSPRRSIPCSVIAADAACESRVAMFL